MHDKMMMALAVFLLVPGPTVAKAPPRPAGKTYDAKLGCNFSLSLKQHGLRPVSWKEFTTTVSSRNQYVTKGHGHGGIRCPRTYRALPGARFYRLYDGTKSVKDGRSFSLNPYPAGDATIRTEMAVCEAWNDLRFATTCTIKPGAAAYVYIGPGESVSSDVCANPNRNETYRERRELQVIFHSKPRDVCDFTP